MRCDTVLVCPRNGEPTPCLVCKAGTTHAHRYEALARRDGPRHKPARCETHDVLLVVQR